ncbi:MAG: UDP-N-acetylmuramoyl-L-alanyl-D-glutamate--2,6-diaminopimelate ligase [Clostridia bacterium]|nr:UDP-N-acetylmuramoyl-L-alanyl-D-glutamate--2,6-diaminopimelate ligase [Clostridia bacterium]
MKTERLFNDVNILSVSGKMPDDIEFITDNSEKVTEKCLFFCRKGNNFDGEKYIYEAINKGAEIIVSEDNLSVDICFVKVKDIKSAMARIAMNFSNNAQKKLKKIGVVGTNGKTTTCHFLSRIFTENGNKTAVIGTIGNYIDGVKYDTELTTPSLLELYKLMEKSVDEGVEVFIMEISAHAIEQRRTEGIVFDAIIFTNCTEDHLDYFKTFEEYERVKMSIFDYDHCAVGIINSDDETGRKILSNKDLPVSASYGLYNPSDVFALNVDEGKNGLKYTVNLFDNVYNISSPIIGLCNVYNSLAAAACAATLGVDMGRIVSALEKLNSVEGRCQNIASFRGASIFVDYAHTPDGLERTLLSMRKICSGKLICVFGCGGNREKEKRPKMGKISGKLADFTIITSDNPRYENPDDIISEIEKGMVEVGGDYVVRTDRRMAVKLAVGLLNAGDVLLIAGKGAEKYQEINGVKYDFSDEKIILSVIGALSEN